MMDRALGRLGGGLASAVLLSALAVGCGGESERGEMSVGGDGGSGGAGGGPTFDDPVTCSAADTTCPASRPALGAPCDPGLSCSYPDEAWSYTCDASGAWQGEQSCEMLVGGACNVTPIAETCQGPTLTGLSGSLEVGPAEAGPFRPFEAGEVAPTEVGGQGSGMLFYRARLVDSEVLPACVEMTTTLTIQGSGPEQVVRHVRLRCGQSAQMYALLPSSEDLCAEDEITAELVVELTGVGSTSVELTLSPEAFCGGIG